MRRFGTLLIFFLFLSSVAYAGPDSDTGVARVRSVTDGAIIKVEYPIGSLLREEVRFLGVAWPELDECFGKEAKQFVTTKLVNPNMLAQQHWRIKLTFEGERRDSDGHLLAWVWYGKNFERLLNADIIREGFGYSDRKYPTSRLDEFNKLEEEARKAGRGLWAPGNCQQFTMEEAFSYKYKEGFQKLQWGMTLPKVRRVIGKKLSPLKVDTEVVKAYTYKDKIAGTQCVIALYFFKGRFYRVLIFFIVESHDSDKFLEKYDKLEEILSEKYGSPYEYETCPNFPLDECSTQWETQETEIGVKLYEEEFQYILNIWYNCKMIVDIVRKEYEKEENRKKKKAAKQL